MFKSPEATGLTITEQEQAAELHRQARIRELIDAVTYIGVKDKFLPQWWLDKRPHALPWLRHWID